MPALVRSSWPSTRRAVESEGQLAQRRQVRLGEELVECDLRPLGRIDVAVLHALAQGVGAHVDQLDLIGALEHLVGQALVDRGSGDRRHGVGDAVEVLDVERRHDMDAGVADHLDVFPALLARRARRVGVGQLVDQRDDGIAFQDGVGIHLLDDDVAVFDAPARDDLQAGEQLFRVRSSVRLDVADDDVGAAREPTVAFIEHAIGLADARGHAQVDAQPAAAASRNRP